LNIEGKNLFHRVILESGAATARLVRPYNYSLLETQFKEFISATGIATGSKIIDDLRSLAIKKIKEASSAVTKKYNDPNDLRWAFQPAIELSSPSGLIRKAPIEAWNAGEWNRVPILTGFCTDEGSIFVDHGMSTPEQFTSFFTKLLSGLTPANIDRLNKLYPAPNAAGSPYADHRIGVGAQFKRVTAAYGQFAYISPVRQTAHYASTSPSPVNVYLYEFAQNMSVNGGAGHVANGGFTMYDERLMLVPSSPNKDKAQKKPSLKQEAMVKTMHAYWTSFIVSGNPNTYRLRGSPEWPTYAPTPAGGTSAGGEDTKGGKNEREVRKNIMVFGRGNDEHAGGTSEGVVAEAAVETTAMEESKNLWWEVTELAESN
jgi:acetylcholinesterase